MIRQTKRLTRPYVRVVQSSYRSFRSTVSAKSPAWLRERLDSTFDYFDLFMVDHGVFRALYSNTHLLSHDVWRSSQPAPRNIRRLAKRGLKTIINLRGDRDCGSYRLEQQACAKYGIELINFTVKSRQAPARQVFHEAKALFDRIEYPVLLHCKSGADRAGLMSVLFLILKAGVPVVEAKRQLSLRFGHIRQADTGVLDFVFDSYLAHSSHEPIAFLDWVDRHYDDKALGQNFKADGWANVVVNKLISRE
jgi:protein tyrosine/serine phosphatase